MVDFVFSLVATLSAWEAWFFSLSHFFPRFCLLLISLWEFVAFALSRFCLAWLLVSLRRRA